jgi:hypothetical protein
MSVPTFVHSFPVMWQHGYEYEESHSIQSGLHVELDFMLNYLQSRPSWRIRKSKALSMLFRGFISFIWGLNCHFPPTDVMRFVIWEARGGRLNR